MIAEFVSEMVLLILVLDSADQQLPGNHVCFGASILSSSPNMLAAQCWLGQASQPTS